MDHVGAVVGRHNAVTVEGHDGRGTGAQPVDAGHHVRRVLFEQIADGLRGKNVSAAAVDAHRDLAHGSQLVQVLRELLGRYLVAPPRTV